MAASFLGTPLERAKPLGYTHYIKLSQTIPADTWSLVLADVTCLLAHLPATGPCGRPLAVRYESDDDRPPVVDAGLIRFNGYDANGADLGHETFYQPREVGEHNTNFCKTAHKPYDLVVCAVALVLTKHAADCVRVTSDGAIAYWMPAWRWVASVLGAGYDLPCDFTGASPYLVGLVQKYGADSADGLRAQRYLDEARAAAAAYEAERMAMQSLAPALSGDTDLSPALGGQTA